MLSGAAAADDDDDDDFLALFFIDYHQTSNARSSTQKLIALEIPSAHLIGFLSRPYCHLPVFFFCRSFSRCCKEFIASHPYKHHTTYLTPALKN
jgi:hypothetical protein